MLVDVKQLFSATKRSLLTVTFTQSSLSYHRLLEWMNTVKSYTFTCSGHSVIYMFFTKKINDLSHITECTFKWQYIMCSLHWKHSMLNVWDCREACFSGGGFDQALPNFSLARGSAPGNLSTSRQYFSHWCHFLRNGVTGNAPGCEQVQTKVP